MIHKDAAKDLITRIAKTPEEAEETVKYLASLNWVDVFRDNQQSRMETIRAHIDMVNETIAKGGGYCYECDGLFDKLYKWPHTYMECGKESSISKERDWQFCRRCFMHRQGNIYAVYLRPSDTMGQCSRCDRLIPDKSTYHIRYGSSSGIPRLKVGGFNTKPYCILCVPFAVEKQFIACSLCGKKTATYADSYCYDCNIQVSPYRTAVSSHLDRARKAGTPATLTLKEWIATVQYFKEYCAYCKSKKYEVLEHFMPISLGGGTTRDNCVPSCHRCNTRKRDKHPNIITKHFSLEAIDEIRKFFADTNHTINLHTNTSRALIIA